MHVKSCSSIKAVGEVKLVNGKEREAGRKANSREMLLQQGLL
jgi:hypothetical protein